MFYTECIKTSHGSTSSVKANLALAGVKLTMNQLGRRKTYNNFRITLIYFYITKNNVDGRPVVTFYKRKTMR